MSDDNIDVQTLEDLFHEKAVDNRAVYTKGHEFGAELFGDLTPEERKQKLDKEVCSEFISQNFLHSIFN